jgi:hypothetical protein
MHGLHSALESTFLLRKIHVLYPNKLQYPSLAEDYALKGQDSTTTECNYCMTWDDKYFDLN